MIRFIRFTRVIRFVCLVTTPRITPSSLVILRCTLNRMEQRTLCLSLKSPSLCAFSNVGRCRIPRVGRQARRTVVATLSPALTTDTRLATPPNRCMPLGYGQVRSLPPVLLANRTVGTWHPVVKLVVNPWNNRSILLFCLCKGGTRTGIAPK